MAIRYGILVVLCVVVILTDAALTGHLNAHHGNSKRRNAFLTKVLQHYKNAISMCTHEHNFACTVDVKSKTTDLMCIDLAWRCDGRPDCPKGEDELDCEGVECADDQIRCCDTGECATACDDKVECAWGEDEQNCEPKELNCGDGKLKCPNGECAVACDGIAQCPGGTDEHDCNVGTGCKVGEYTCASLPGKNVTCATPCDNKVECADSADEIECQDQICPDNTTPCLTREPVGSLAYQCANLCDFDVECEDARDERHAICKACISCETTSPTDQCVFIENCPGF